MAVPCGQPGEGRANITWQGVVRGVRSCPADIWMEEEEEKGQEVPQVPQQKFLCSLWRDYKGAREKWEEKAVALRSCYGLIANALSSFTASGDRWKSQEWRNEVELRNREERGRWCFNFLLFEKRQPALGGPALTWEMDQSPEVPSNLNN